MEEANWVSLDTITRDKLGIDVTSNTYKNISKQPFEIRLNPKICYENIGIDFINNTNRDLTESLKISTDLCLLAFFKDIHTLIEGFQVFHFKRSKRTHNYAVNLVLGTMGSLRLKSKLKKYVYKDSYVSEIDIVLTDLYEWHYCNNINFYTWLVKYLEINILTKDTKIKEKIPMSTKAKKTSALTTAVKSNTEMTKAAAKVAIDIEAGKLGVKFLKEQIKPFLPEHIAILVDTTEGEFLVAQLGAFLLQASSGMHKHEDLAISLSNKMITYSAVQELGKFDIGTILVEMAKSMGLDAGKLVSKETKTTK